jgi:hypothetical protein
MAAPKTRRRIIALIAARISTHFMLAEACHKFLRVDSKGEEIKGKEDGMGVEKHLEVGGGDVRKGRFLDRIIEGDRFQD